MMEDDSFDYESEAVYVSTHVQDLISLAEAYERVKDRKLQQRMLAAIDAVLTRLTLHTLPKYPVKQ